MDMKKPTDEQQPNVSPEEQAQYDAFMKQARGILMGTPDSDQSMVIVLEKLKAGRDDIGTAIGDTAAKVLRSVASGIEGKGRQVPQDILFAAGDEVVDELIEMAVAVGFMKEEQSEKIKKQAVFEGLRVYGENEIQSGKLTPEKRAAAQAEMKEVLAKSGARPAEIATAAPAPSGIIDSRRK